VILYKAVAHAFQAN